MPHGFWQLALLLVVFSTYVFFAPFTKVEESFNVQAVHDFLYKGLNVKTYDHKEFPGVVPRSFSGALFIATINFPIRVIVTAFNFSKVILLYTTRLTVGAFVAHSVWQLYSVVGERFAPQVTTWATLFTVTQFQLCFWGSRTLPNFFAFPLVQYALVAWLRGSWRTYFLLGGAATLVLRSELMLFFGPLTFFALVTKRLSIWELFTHGIPAAAMVLGATIPIDSFLWGRLVWPEGSVFWFNTVLNKSPEWGVSSWHWYFTSALPRTLFTATPFAAFGLFIAPRPVQQLGGCALAFLALYSLLPHKEVRFVIYTVPIFNLAAGFMAHRMKLASSKNVILNFLTSSFLYFSLLINALLALYVAVISVHNYPGASASLQLQQDFITTPSATVYIDNYPAQSGVSQFVEVNPGWSFNKTERLSVAELSAFDFIVTKEWRDMKRPTSTGDNATRPLHVWLKDSHKSLFKISSFQQLYTDCMQFVQEVVPAPLNSVLVFFCIRIPFREPAVEVLRLVSATTTF